MAHEYDLNDSVTFRCNFKVSGVDTDPTTITLFIREPDGTERTYTDVSSPPWTKDSVGNYSRVRTLSIRGVWYYVWTGTGACQASAQGTITVRY